MKDITDTFAADQTLPAPPKPDPEALRERLRSEALAPGNLVGGRYMILRMIGQGGMGSVFEAVDQLLRRQVAIKVFHRHIGAAPVLRKRFHVEALAAARIKSPHVVTIYDFCFDENGPSYIVQDLVSGEPLRRIIETEPALDPVRAIRLADQVCSGLEDIHQAGFVHRDIKPDNLMVGRTTENSEHVVILDLGIAKVLDGDRDLEATGQGTVIGTVRYMAPEQAQGRLTDPRADLFSLGVILYEMLEGRPPFAYRGSLQEQMQAILYKKPDRWLRNAATPALQAVVLRCLEKPPDDRFPSARALREALGDTPEGRSAGLRRWAPETSVALPPAAPPAPMSGPPSTQAFFDDPEAGRDVILDRQGPAPRQRWWLRPAAFSLAGALFAAGAVAAGDTPVRWYAAALAGAVLLGSAITGRKARRALGPAPQPTTLPTSSQDAGAGEAVGADLLAYLEAAGLHPAGRDGGLLLLARDRRSSLPPGEWAAMEIEGEAAPAATATLVTEVFQVGARPIYRRRGTADRPLYVVVLIRSELGEGVLKEWHELAARHVHVLPVDGGALRAVLEGGSAASHLLGLTSESLENPFAREAPVSGVDFAGARSEVKTFLGEVNRGRSLALFGQRKWGTTSLIFRFRAELGDRASTVIDLATEPDTSFSGLTTALHDSLAQAFARRAGHSLTRRRRTGALDEAGAREDLRRILAAFRGAQLGPPVVFLDRVDQLVRGERSDPATLIAFARHVCHFALVPGDPELILLVAGHDEGVLFQRTFPRGAGELENPLYRKLFCVFAPLFTADETARFLTRMGARAGIAFSPAAAGRIFQLTGGHKYLTRVVAGAISDRRLRRTTAAAATPDEVREAGQLVVTRYSDYFDAILAGAPRATRDLLARLVRGPATRSELLGLVPGAVPRADQLPAVNFAVNYGLARDDGGLIHLAVGLLGDWLALTSPAIAAVAPNPQPEAVSSERVVVPQAVRWSPDQQGSDAEEDLATQVKESRDDAAHAPTDPAVNKTRVGGFGAGFQGTIIASRAPVPGEGDKQALRTIMIRGYATHELAILVSDLGGGTLEKVAAPHQPIEGIIQDVLNWAERTNRFDALRQRVQEDRPYLFDAG